MKKLVKKLVKETLKVALTFITFVAILYMALYANKVYYERNCYRKYYETTEDLLDSLQIKYDWIDEIDNYDYYDAKYNVVLFNNLKD